VPQQGQVNNGGLNSTDRSVIVFAIQVVKPDECAGKSADDKKQANDNRHQEIMSQSSYNDRTENDNGVAAKCLPAEATGSPPFLSSRQLGLIQ
jgi:hypothetical protein